MRQGDFSQPWQVGLCATAPMIFIEFDKLPSAARRWYCNAKLGQDPGGNGCSPEATSGNRHLLPDSQPHTPFTCPHWANYEETSVVVRAHYTVASAKARLQSRAGRSRSRVDAAHIDHLLVFCSLRSCLDGLVLELPVSREYGRSTAVGAFAFFAACDHRSHDCAADGARFQYLAQAKYWHSNCNNFTSFDVLDLSHVWRDSFIL